MTSGPFGGDLMAGPPPTLLPADPADAELAGGEAPAAVVRRHPESPAAWAAMAAAPTVIAGVYGMNFDHMPELHWGFGYPFALGLMVLSSLIVYVISKRAGWL